MRIPAYLALASCVLILQAQDMDLNASLASAAPEVEKLLQAMQPKIALERSASILPGSKPMFSTSDLNALKASTRNYRALSAMHLLHGKAAQAAGDWDLARKAYDQGLTVAQENQALYDQNSQFTVDGLMRAMASGEELKKQKADQIKELVGSAKNIKSNPLEILKIQQAIQEADSQIKTTRESVAFVKEIKKDLASDVAVASQAKSKLEEAFKVEQEGIEAFNKAKKKEGKAAWVAATLQDTGNLAKYPGSREQCEFLHRLWVLDPANENISGLIQGVRQGKPAFAESKAPAKKSSKKAVKPAKKSKKKK